MVLRRLGAGVWEAAQPQLGRRVALRRIPPGEHFDAAQWPDRPGIVRLYAVVPTPSGTFIATRFVEGARTLLELERSRPSRRRRWFDEVETALDRVVHGDLTEQDILVGADGHAVVTGFGRTAPGATAAEDRAALERMRADGRRRPHVVHVAAVVAALVAIGIFVLKLAGDAPRPRPPAPAPAIVPGAAELGSALGPGPLATVDCEGRVPSGSSLPCTILQTALPGRLVVAPFDGIVRSWAVRGARGRLALQILRETPDGFTTFNRTRLMTADEPVELFRANRSVPAGAHFALEVAPGAGIGVRRGSPGAATARFFGPVRAAASETTDTRGGAGEELLLRVDIVPRVQG